MLRITASPALRGRTGLPGDKSISHRAALFAALADGISTIENFLDAGVTRRMLAALDLLDVPYTLQGTRLTVHGRGTAGFRPPASALDCGNSATTIRLLAGAIAAAGLPAVLDGSAGLRARPMNRIVLPLLQMGVPITAENGHAPLTFQERKGEALHSTSFELHVASAQVKSCLLLAGLAADGPVRILEPGPSRDHSERMLTAMGASITQRTLSRPDGSTHYETVLEPGAVLQPIRMQLPGDISSAAFLITAALITPGSDLTLQNVGLNPTRTGLLDAYLAMGAKMDVMEKGLQNGEPYGDLHVRHSPLKGTAIEGPLVVRMIDEFPVFSIAAALADGPTTVKDAVELRHKESDRIRSISKQLQAVGMTVEERPDGFFFPGNARPSGGTVDPQGDHRIAMALACAGLVSSSPITIRQPSIIHESFPEFVPTLQQLGAAID